MHLIKFYKDKITTFVFDDLKGDFLETDINELCLPLNRHLSKFVDFEEDFTVKDFITHLNNHKKDIENIFSSYMNNVSFDEIYEEILQEKEPDYLDDINELEIVWETDLFKDKEIKEYFIHERISYIGVYFDENENEEDEIYIKSMNFMPMRNWKDLPISINRFITYQEINYNERTNNFSKPKNKLAGLKSVSLFQLISGFLSELTIYGSPKTQLEISKKINSKIEEMKDSGKESFEFSIPFDDLETDEFKSKNSTKLLEIELKKALEEEEYLRAKQIKEKLDKLKNK
jgi:hypothetical protein